MELVTAQKYFVKKVKIVVESGMNREETIVTVPLKFAMLLRIDDKLFFGSELETMKPKWVIEFDENFHYLQDCGITITERTINEESILFFAKYL
jgi:hypothetical protein